MVESDEGDSTNPYYHCTEKTLKAIIFSKLNIPFIYYANHNLIQELIQDGFWFLNFEFIERKENITETDVDLSIKKSIKYLNNLYKEIGKYDDVYDFIVNKFQQNMQNNYNLFLKIQKSKDLTNELLDFIIYNFKSNIKIL
jgi:hypothetical protein